MTLCEEILKDYGTICLELGNFLLTNNMCDFESIRASTSLAADQIRDGLTILIQKRIVKYFEFDQKVKYGIDKRMIQRRLYFPIYVNFISMSYKPYVLETFKTILFRGTYKHHVDINGSEESRAIDMLLSDNLLINEDIRSRKISKQSNKLIIINFDSMDTKILEGEIYKFICYKYNTAAGDLYRSILKTEYRFHRGESKANVNRDGIIENLKNTKILIDDRGVILNEKQNIDEYTRYLVNGGFIKMGVASAKEYLVDYSTKALKIFRVNSLLTDMATKRLFNMIANNKYVSDGEITIYSLISLNKSKLAILNLQRLGIISQKCATTYKSNSRIEHEWYIDYPFLSQNISTRLEQIIEKKLKEYNAHWDVNFFLDDVDGAEDIWISDLLGLCTDHLIFNLE